MTIVGFFVGEEEASALAEAEAGVLEALTDGFGSDDDLLQEARASDDTHRATVSAAALTGRYLFELTCLRLPERRFKTIEAMRKNSQFDEVEELTQLLMSKLTHIAAPQPL
ncbi:hypothetical protein CP880_03605 [Cutibacterium namnetense]|uniref:Uncharacterized protein n=1 Tax=Cutibacterium namnetense TaxID=1574624 RepID=A0ABX9IFE9_9ACTN|nr:hypothetical protein [Cutibacterium namnetense]REB71301.1 hypothetical protein CP880_03605 [Cutibacterium namnetense]TKW72585.1 MAG: hypothetical protein DI580_03315 [Cutibacterium acnes]